MNVDGHWLLFTLRGEPAHHFLHVADEEESIVSAINSGAYRAYVATKRIAVSCELTAKAWMDVALYLSERGIDLYEGGGALVINAATGPIRLLAGSAA